MEMRFDATPEELHVFSAETDELLQGLDEQLVRLERDGASPELLKEVFRAAHTIKGSSASIGHTRMARLTHSMETLLDRMRRGELGASAALVERLFEALDFLKVLATEVEQGRQSDVNVESLSHALETWEADAEATAGANAPTADRKGVRPTALESPEGATHHVLLGFESSPWVAVRALQSLIALDDVAEVLVSHPSRSAIEQATSFERLEAWLRTDRPEAELRQVLAEVPETTILSLVLAEEMAAALHAEQATAGAAEPGPADASPEGRASGPAARNGARASSATVRIDVERLDTLLNLVGELVIDRTRLLELGRHLADQVGEHRLLSDLNETTLHLGRVTDELQAQVMKSRMLPIGTVFSRFPRVTRDLATRQGKRVELVVEGQETELDRSVIEEIGDPLVHLLRNAIDHGVETPENRLAAGKPEIAVVRLAAEHAESSIVILVEDDGRGIDAGKLKAQAIERGVISAEVAARMTQNELVDLIFAPGFSTATEVSDISGRGVGMDIVRTNVERLGGSVEVQTKLGEGTRFVLRLPLTLAIVQALLVRVDTSIYALPLSSVTETLRVRANEIQRMQRQEAILLRGRVLPIVRLSAVFGCRATRRSKDVLVVAVKVGDRQIGLMVDALLGEQEVVIKGLGPLVGDVPGISSAAILGDGTVALIMDVPGLVQRLVAEKYEWMESDESELTIGVGAGA